MWSLNDAKIQDLHIKARNNREGDSVSLEKYGLF